jgi:hypothetical protein
MNSTISFIQASPADTRGKRQKVTTSVAEASPVITPISEPEPENTENDIGTLEALIQGDGDDDLVPEEDEEDEHDEDSSEENDHEELPEITQQEEEDISGAEEEPSDEEEEESDESEIEEVKPPPKKKAKVIKSVVKADRPKKKSTTSKRTEKPASDRKRTRKKKASVQSVNQQQGATISRPIPQFSAESLLDTIFKGLPADAFKGLLCITVEADGSERSVCTGSKTTSKRRERYKTEPTRKKK